MTTVDPAEVASNGEPLDDDPFALTLDEFIELQFEQPPPLLGTQRNTILPVGGLGIIAGKEGIGKTTLVIDLVFHLASGIPWLGFDIPRPVNVCIVENEGPQHAFREKLHHKRDHWEAERGGEIYIHSLNWGGLRFDDRSSVERASEFLDEAEVDVVVGDPLDSLGVRGVGAPDDVREFVDLLVPLGLKTSRAFVLLHHLRKESADNELDEISGVWGRPADAIVTVKWAGTDQLRINPLKLRHARDTLKPVVAGMVREVSGFELLGEEGDPRLLEEELTEVLREFGERRPVAGGEDSPWRTLRDLCEKTRGGIGSRRQLVEACLKGSPHLFVAINGREVGRSARATCWQLVENATLRPERTGATESSADDETTDTLWDSPEDVSDPPDTSGHMDSGEV